MNDSHGCPKVAIIYSNTLAVIGLKQLLQTVMPLMEIDAFGSLDELEAAGADNYYHFFAAMSVVLEHRKFFEAHRMKTIVLTTSVNSNSRLASFHSLCISVPEPELVRSLLMLEQRAHRGGHNLPALSLNKTANVLSLREIEVLSLIVQGYINKEIADRLNIGLSTVVTHRRNIMDKLGMRSVSALTIYAVMNGYVDVDNI